jgi:hypothetical protein
MKKLMLIMIAAMFSVAVSAQDKKTTEIKPGELPKAVSEYVAKNLGGGTIVRAGKIDEKGVISYAAVVETGGQKRAFIFDKDGKFVGKADNIAKPAAPTAKPPVKSDTKPATTPAATETAAPKK